MRKIRAAALVASALLAFPALAVVDFVPPGLAPEGDAPSDVAFSPDGQKIVVSHRDSKNLVVFDALTRDVLQVIPLSGSPEAVEVSSDGIHAVTANLWEDTASIVRLDTAEEVATVPVGIQPAVVRITPDGTKAAVSNTVTADLSIIDIAGATELLRIPGASQNVFQNMNWETGNLEIDYNDFELASNTKLVFPDYDGNKVKIFDIEDGSFVAIGTPEMTHPQSVAVTPDGTRAIVSHGQSTKRISVIDVPGESLIKVITVGFDLRRPLTVNPAATKAAIVSGSSCHVLDLVSETVSGGLCTGGDPEELLTTADGDYVLAVNVLGQLISYASASVVKALNGANDPIRGAVSPSAAQAALIGASWDEDLAVVNTAGAAGFLEEVVPSGPPPEGDRTRSVAISPDGTKAVMLGYASHTASIVDLPTRTVTAVVEVGTKPTEAEITPDGALAVVANLGSPFVSVIDLVSHAVTNVPISIGGNQVEISPDGQTAYVAVVAADGVWRIDLGTLTVNGPKLATGDMDTDPLGSFKQRAGMTLSHDGGTLITCNAVTHNVTIIDTASWAVVSTKGLGGIPTRAVFSADDSTIYVSESYNDRIFRINNAGAASAVTANLTVFGSPTEMVLDGGTLYVMTTAGGNIIMVTATGTMAVTGLISLPGVPTKFWVDPVQSRLYVATGSMSVGGGAQNLILVQTTGEFRVVDIPSKTVLASIDTDVLPGEADAFGAPSLFAIPSPLADGMTVVELLAAGDVENSLTIAKIPGGKIRLFWNESCTSTDGDYEIYAGVLGNYYSHHHVACSTFGNTFFTLTPSIGSAYYLVVPRTEVNEGSYGRDSGGRERPPAVPACELQDFGGCP